ALHPHQHKRSRECRTSYTVLQVNRVGLAPLVYLIIFVPTPPSPQGQCGSLIVGCPPEG
ncbi:hypothetical protein NDU88_004208, partial [Pleurodeles waltl]